MLQNYLSIKIQPNYLLVTVHKFLLKGIHTIKVKVQLKNPMVRKGYQTYF